MTRIRQKRTRGREQARAAPLAAWQPRPVASLLARFWERVTIHGGYGQTWNCWVWTGAFRKRNGKPILYDHRGIARDAAMIAYTRTVGPLPPSSYLVRLCDTERCVRPDHHLLVTRGARGHRGVANPGSGTANEREGDEREEATPARSRRAHPRRPLTSASAARIASRATSRVLSAAAAWSLAPASATTPSVAGDQNGNGQADQNANESDPGARLLRQWREERGYTLEALASLLELRRAMLARLESGTVRVPRWVFFALRGIDHYRSRWARDERDAT